MTLDELRAAMPAVSLERAAIFVGPLSLAMVEHAITTPQRQSAFLAQLAHESGSLRYVRELGDGEGYEGRIDLGNTQPGDGLRFIGRGLIQITGRSNYTACGKALGLDLTEHPKQLEQPIQAAASASWFWQSRELNALADTDKFGTICHRVNGGYRGLDERLQHWIRIRKVLGL